MDAQNNHKITICTSCKHKGTACQPGFELTEKLRAAMAAAGEAITEDFEISGVACLVGCDRPCTVAYHGSRKATYLFGDVDPDVDVSDLVSFAQQFAHLHDGWRSSRDRPAEPRTSMLERVPAAIIALEASEERAS